MRLFSICQVIKAISVWPLVQDWWRGEFSQSRQSLETTFNHNHSSSEVWQEGLKEDWRGWVMGSDRPATIPDLLAKQGKYFSARLSLTQWPFVERKEIKHFLSSQNSGQGLMKRVHYLSLLPTRQSSKRSEISDQVAATMIIRWIHQMIKGDGSGRKLPHLAPASKDLSIWSDGSSANY